MIDPSKPPRLSIALLGSFQLRADGKPCASIPRKAKALLAYLAMQEERPVSREAMADLLWSDRGAEQARHSLRQMLLVLRRDLGAAGLIAIDAGEHAISFQLGAVETDVARMHRLAAATDCASLAEVADLYTGPFLADFPSVCPDFDAWVRLTRDRIASSVLDILGRLADLCGAEGDAVGAVMAVERMVALDPLREDIHRRMMTAYAAAGRRTDAIRQYNACVEMLRRDLDASAEAETVALVQRIREGGLVKAPSEPVIARPAVDPQPTGGPPWVAILPFTALGPNPVAPYLYQGFADDLVYNLAALREPVVISSHSTRDFINTNANPRQIALDLNVRYIVTGSIRQSGEMTRISVELLFAESSMVVWAQSFDVTGGMWFDAQDQIVGRIVSSLVRYVDESELRRSRAKPPNQMTAYDLRLQAQELIFKLDRGSFDQAGDLLRRAVAIDPRYAPAHATLVDWHSLRVGQGWSDAPGADMAALDIAARAAIACDAHYARALASFGHNRSFLYRDYDSATNFFARALEAAPNDATVWKWTSSTYSYMGDGAEGTRRAMRALELSPRDPFAYGIYSSLCLAAYVAGAYEDSVIWGLQSFRENPRYTSNSRYLAAGLVALGRIGDAQEIAQSLMSIQPNFRVQLLTQRHPFRDPAERALLGQRLVQAGLKP